MKISIVSTPASLVGSSIVKVPSISHHQFKVSVVVNRHADVIIVFKEFFEANLLVASLSRMYQAVMHFKCVKELNENLILCFSSQLNIWVVLSIVHIFEIIKFNNTVSISIQLLESSLHELLSLRVHLTNNNSQKLVVADGSILIEIKNGEKYLSLFLSYLNPIVLDGLVEFWKLKHSIVVIIDNLKDSSEADNAAGTSLSELVSEFLEDLFIRASIAGSATVLLNIHLLSRGCSSNSLLLCLNGRYGSVGLLA